MSYKSGEPDGYCAAAVSKDGTIHLITSRNHYAFNLAWLSTRPDPPPHS
jgi:formylglycine-generating enzyme